MRKTTQNVEIEVVYGGIGVSRGQRIKHFRDVARCAIVRSVDRYSLYHKSSVALVHALYQVARLRPL